MSFTLQTGTAPILVSMPHIATHISPELAGDFVPAALSVQDTDWHLDQLYSFLPELGASVLMPSVSRYVIDLNRPPDDTPMYPGAANTELCPTRFFTGEVIYKEGCTPNAASIAARRKHYWQPYHGALATELARIKAQHGYAILWDAHSIRSELPWLFEGKLPDLNIGTANGDASHPAITAAVAQICAEQSDFSHVVNGRFKGGYITRHYGKPSQNIHGIQLEKCWSTYMQETPPFAFDASIAAGVQPLLKRMIQAALASAKALHG
jgi:N-formylglutamate deformylase